MHWVFVAVCRLSLAGAGRLTAGASGCRGQALGGVGFGSCCLQAL